VVICRGDVYWADLTRAAGSEPGNRRPVVVVQRDAINRSAFGTVLVVPLTKQTKHASLPGNVLLDRGEANLPRRSLARGTHVMVVDKARLTEKIGSLSPDKIRKIIDSIVWILEGENSG